MKSHKMKNSHAKRTRKHRHMLNMRGCLGKKSCLVCKDRKECCTCGKKGHSCRQHAMVLRGGDVPPLIGAPYTPTNLPGEAGLPGQTNYYALNTYVPFDPQTQNIISERNQMTLGGSRKRRMKRGGGILPQDLVNLGRNITYNLGSAYNAINGYPAPVNPMPYNDQLVNSQKMMGYF